MIFGCNVEEYSFEYTLSDNWRGNGKTKKGKEKRFSVDGSSTGW